MEISNEIKAKVFALYLGQKIRFINSKNNLDWSILRPSHLYLDNEFKLILKPISAITDEDAIDIAVLAGMTRPMNRFEFVISRHINYTKRILSEYFEGYKHTEEIITYNVWLSIFQYLQSKGYDIPQYLLGGKKLHEVGLAIYENE